MTVDEDDAEDRRQCSCDPGVSFPVLFELQDALAVLIVGVHRVKGLEEHFYHTGPRWVSLDSGAPSADKKLQLLVSPSKGMNGLRCICCRH